MRITIPTDIFCRIATARFRAETKPDNLYLTGVTIETMGETLLIMATNRQIMVTEKIETVKNVAEISVCCSLPPEFMAALEIEKSLPNSVIFFDYLPEFSVLTAMTAYGYKHPTNLFLHQPDDWSATWRRLFPQPLSKDASGFIFMECEQIALMGEASPTGRIVFPEIIDTSKPVTVNDAGDFAWCGVFLCRPDGEHETTKPAKSRGWI